MTRSFREETQPLVFGYRILRTNVNFSLFILRMTLGQPSVFGLMLLARFVCKTLSPVLN